MFSKAFFKENELFYVQIFFFLHWFGGLRGGNKAGTISQLQKSCKVR